MKKILGILLLLPCLSFADLIPVQRAIEDITATARDIHAIQKTIGNNSPIINDEGDLVIRYTENSMVREVKLEEQLAKLDKNLKKTTNRLNEIRKIVTDSPTINNDIRNLQSQVKYLESSILSVQKSVESVSELGKWFLGSLITITLGLFALLFPLAVKSIKSKP